MRFDPMNPIRAEDILNEYSEQELAQVLFRYGEESLANPIARAIILARPVTTTTAAGPNCQPGGLGTSKRASERRTQTRPTSSHPDIPGFEDRGQQGIGKPGNSLTDCNSGAQTRRKNCYHLISFPGRSDRQAVFPPRKQRLPLPASPACMHLRAYRQPGGNHQASTCARTGGAETQSPLTERKIASSAKSRVIAGR